MAQKKFMQRIIAGCLVAIGLVVGIYQYKFSKIKTESKEQVLVAKSDIFPGEELTKDNITVEYRGIESIADGTITNLKDGLGSKAKEKILKKESVVESRIVTAQEYEKLDMRLVSISGFDSKRDMFSAYEIKPFDKVDIYFYDSTGTYEGKPYMEGAIVADIKSVDGISYINRVEGFIPSYATFWLTSEQSQVIHQKLESGGYVKLVPQRDRSTIDDKIEKKGE